MLSVARASSAREGFALKCFARNAKKKIRARELPE